MELHQAFRLEVPKCCETIRKPVKPSGTSSFPRSVEVKHPEVNTGLAGGFEVDPRGSHDQAMVDYTELGTLVGPTIL